MTASGLIIGAARSGAGKTTLALGLMRALARRGLKVGAAKCGPDYIDPAFHAAATGCDSLNLDSWTMREDERGDWVVLAMMSSFPVSYPEAWPALAGVPSGAVDRNRRPPGASGSGLRQASGPGVRTSRASALAQDEGPVCRDRRRPAATRRGTRP